MLLITRVKDIQDIYPFKLPLPQTALYTRHKVILLPIDNGIREVDVVTHNTFPESARRKILKLHEQDNQCALQSLKKGDFVVLQIDVLNCATYPFKFVIGQIIEDVSGKDTTNPDTKILFQLYRPSTITKIESKMVPWIGDNNQYWREEFDRGHVKAIVQLQTQGKKLTANSRKMIENAFF